MVRDMGALVETLTETVQAQNERIEALEAKGDAAEPDSSLDDLVGRVVKLESVTISVLVKQFAAYGIHFHRMA